MEVRKIVFHALITSVCLVLCWAENCLEDGTIKSCYHIFDTNITWKKAFSVCRRGGGNLVVIEKETEQNFIQGLMAETKFNASGLWIGSDKLHPENIRSWVNGHKMNYVNWATGEPNIAKSFIMFNGCMRIYTYDGKWNMEHCKEMNGYICENSDEVRNYTQDNTTGSWYKLEDIEITWKEAFNICMKDGSELMIIETAKEQTFIADQIQKSMLPLRALWIGANDASGYPKWVNGKDIQYENWADSNRNVLKEDNCAEMFTSNYKWNDEKCSSPRGYICENTYDVTADKSHGHIILISVIVLSALVLAVGVSLFCYLVQRRNKRKKRMNEHYQNVQNMNANQADHVYNRYSTQSDTYWEIEDDGQPQTTQ